MFLEDQILQAIKAAMPANAEIQVGPGIGAFNVGVSWKLNNDPERPNKMSKTISICVSHEAAQDFANASVVDQGSSSQRVIKFLTKKLATFDPEHNTPKYEAPPVEQWVINSAVVLG